MIYLFVAIYLVGYVMAYRAMKKEAMEEFGLEWTYGTRSFALFCSLCSWLVVIVKMADSDKKAKW